VAAFVIPFHKKERLHKLVSEVVKDPIHKLRELLTVSAEPTSPARHPCPDPRLEKLSYCDFWGPLHRLLIGSAPSLAYRKISHAHRTQSTSAVGPRLCHHCGLKTASFRKKISSAPDLSGIRIPAITSGEEVMILRFGNMKLISTSSNNKQLRAEEGLLVMGSFSQFCC